MSARNYDDIMHLPHHQSKTRPHMSNYDRAAQFSPFAALKGYDDEIAETARATDGRDEADAAREIAINDALLLIKERIARCPIVRIMYFRADEKKEGGAYHTIEDKVKKLDEYGKKLILSDGEIIPFDEIVEIELL